MEIKDILEEERLFHFMNKLQPSSHEMTKCADPYRKHHHSG
jgi:hypothetical protein